MTKRIVLILFLASWAFVFQAGAEEKFDLRRCYELALKRSETVAISQEEINQAKARYTQALGTVLPKVTIIASEFLQDDSAQGNTATAAGNVANTFTRFSRPQVAVNVYQNLFQGFKEMTALRLSNVDQAQQRFKKEDVERLLYKDVATAFYTIAEIELEIQTIQKEMATVRARLNEIRERVKLGKNRESEVLAQEADLSLLDAGLEERRGLRKVAYDMMSFLTGLRSQPPIFVRDPIGEKLRSVEEYKALATLRPDVMASKKGIELARGQVKIQKGDLLPNANAQFNYYPYRVGFQKDIHWDATFTMNIPVFNWGTFGYIREAKSKAKQAEIQSELSFRLALNEIEKAYDTYRSSLSQYRKYRTAVKKSEASYQKQVEDFSLGLINNLEVLQSQRTYFAALRLFNDSKVRAWADYAALQIIAGIKP